MGPRRWRRGGRVAGPASAACPSGTPVGAPGWCRRRTVSRPGRVTARRRRSAGPPGRRRTAAPPPWSAGTVVGGRARRRRGGGRGRDRRRAQRRRVGRRPRRRIGGGGASVGLEAPSLDVAGRHRPRRRARRWRRSTTSRRGSRPNRRSGVPFCWPHPVAGYPSMAHKQTGDGVAGRGETEQFGPGRQDLGVVAPGRDRHARHLGLVRRAADIDDDGDDDGGGAGPAHGRALPGVRAPSARATGRRRPARWRPRPAATLRREDHGPQDGGQCRHRPGRDRHRRSPRPALTQWAGHFNVGNAGGSVCAGSGNATPAAPGTACSVASRLGPLSPGKV